MDKCPCPPAAMRTEWVTIVSVPVMPDAVPSEDDATTAEIFPAAAMLPELAIVKITDTNFPD